MLNFKKVISLCLCLIILVGVLASDNLLSLFATKTLVPSAPSLVKSEVLVGRLEEVMKPLSFVKSLVADGIDGLLDKSL